MRDSSNGVIQRAAKNANAKTLNKADFSFLISNLFDQIRLTVIAADGRLRPDFEEELGRKVRKFLFKICDIRLRHYLDSVGV